MRSLILVCILVGIIKFISCISDIDENNLESRQLGFGFWSHQAKGKWSSVVVSSSGQYVAGVQTQPTLSLGFSSDFGASWYLKEKTITVVAISGSGKVMAWADNGISMTISPGDGQDLQVVPFPSLDVMNVTSQWCQAITVSSSGTGIATAINYRVNGTIEYSKMYLTSDSGDNWSTTMSLEGVSVLSLTQDYSGQYLGVATSETIIYISSNYGYVWVPAHEISGHPYYSASLVTSNSGQFYIMTGRAKIQQVVPLIVTSNDFGVTWTERNSTIDFDHFAVDKTGANVFGISMNWNSIYVSRDFGDSFDLYGAPSMIFTAVTTDSSAQHVFGSSATTDASGIYEFSPSELPSSMPSSMPSSRPTSKPTTIPGCPAGTYYEFTEATPERFICIPCAAGEYSYGHALHCQTCDIGSYSADGTDCVLCPANTYSTLENAVSCTACAFGLASDPGSKTEESCINPTLNFAIAFVCVAATMLGTWLYIVGGRLHRMSFVRREKLVAKSLLMCSMAYEQLLVVGQLCRDTAALEMQQREAMSSVIKGMRALYLTIVTFVVVAIVFALFFFGAIIRLFFTSLILWRGYSVVFDVPYLDRITQVVDDLCSVLAFPSLRYIFYPFLYVADVLASFNISLASVRVTCVGSQMPIRLLIDCFVVGVAVIVIQSEMEVYWCTAFAKVHTEFRAVLLQAQFWRGNVFTKIKYVLWSFALLLMPHPRKVLQYFLGLVRVMMFFNTNGHAASSANCDAVTKGVIGLDSLLAFLSTAVAYLLILPVIYVFSQVLVPSFALEPGTVEPEPYIKRHLTRSAASSCQCGKCGRGLMRLYSNHFESFHCDCPTHVDKVATSVSAKLSEKVRAKLSTDSQVLYGCSTMTSCNYAVCAACYAKSKAADETAEEAVVKEQRAWSCSAMYLQLLGMVTSIDWFYVKFTFVFAHAMNRMMGGQTERMNSTASTTATPVQQSVNSAKDTDTSCSVEENTENADSARSDKSTTDQKSDAAATTEPTLLWFYAMRKFRSVTPAERAAETAETRSLDNKWAKISASFPTYYRMVLTVYADLKPKPVHHDVACSHCTVSPIVGARFANTSDKSDNLCEHCAVVTGSDKSSHREFQNPAGCCSALYDFLILCVSWTIFGQLYSERGRKIWTRVLLNYRIFAQVVFGLWTDKAARDFELRSRFKAVETANVAIMKNASAKLRAISTHKTDKGTVFSKQVVRNAVDGGVRGERMQQLSALVSSRVVLIQLIPYLTLLSTVAVDVAESPILVFSPELCKQLPDLFHTSAFSKAAEILVAMDNNPDPWKVALLGVYMFVEQSRGVQFLLNVLMNAIAFLLITVSRESVPYVIAFALLLFLCMALVSSFYPLILLNKMMFPTLKRKVKATHDIVPDNDVDVEGGGDVELHHRGNSSPSGTSADEDTQMGDMVVEEEGSGEAEGSLVDAAEVVVVADDDFDEVDGEDLRYATAVATTDKDGDDSAV